MDLHEQLGSIDVYLFDQVLRGRFDRRRRILDVGCGAGRNLRWFLRQGYEVHGLDRDPSAVDGAREQARRLAGDEAAGRFEVGDAMSMSYEAARFDAVIVNAVLHFASGPANFDAIVRECGRVLAPGGLFFARLCSSIGLEGRVRPLGDGRFQIPDGTRRFLVDRPALESATAVLGGTLADPVKTVLVEDLRAMTTWVVVKDGVGSC